MIEERARVMEAGSGYAWLEIQRRTACGGCQTSAGCGTAVLATLWEGKTIRVRAVSATPLQPGDEVIVGLADGVLLRGAVLVYLLPVILLLLGSALGQAAFGAAGEALVALSGLLGLGLGLLAARALAGRFRDDDRYQPVVLRRTSATFTGGRVISSS
ncbi:MAG TPA: SoxR reducing system RseC family protein [Candidatus Competibacter sp.]|nr:Fis family transcriptional regulator [Candidatus Competibacteraceae bacterium]HRE53841.1 SoxR reducing system RseC family protein [Candidatus Competibacter sp.]HUM94578.1 SoxR reducing system RseC family protein [Candidatus Competibacter sp.]